MGIKFDNTVMSKLCFLKRGLIVACLKYSGTVPSERILSIISRIHGPTASKFLINKRVGIISVKGVVGFNCLVYSRRGTIEIGSNSLKDELQAGGTEES